MKLKSLVLRNIRSYTDHNIDFKEGISLFEGDVGSGKSSILNALEFALFGLGNLSGAHLLRVGEASGRVELTIEVNNRTYTFGRSLKRKRGKVNQDECFIVEGGVQTYYNATDMKRRSLQILNFREPLNPRSHSVIYRFAIFTPQEQMKEVINQRPERRKETLRKAFGIEEYSVAVGSADLIRRELHSEVRALKTSEEEIEGINKKMTDENITREEEEERITDAEKRLDDTWINIEEVEEAINKKEEEEEALRDLATSIQVFNQSRSQSRRELGQIIVQLVENSQKLDDVEEAEGTCQKLESAYNELNELKKNIQSLESKQEEYNEEMHNKALIESSIESERKSIEDRLKRAKIRVESIRSRTASVIEVVAEISSLEGGAEKLEREASNIEELRKDHTWIRESAHSAKQQAVHLSSMKQEKEGEWTAIEKLGIGAQCPRCQQRLTEEHYTIVKTNYSNELSELEDKILSAKKSHREHETVAEKLQLRIAEEEEKIGTLQQIRLKLEGLKAQRENLERLEEEQEGVVSEASELESLLEDDGFAKEKSAQLEKIESNLLELSPYAHRYSKFKVKIERYEADEVERKYLTSRGVADRKQEYQGLKAHLEKRKVLVEENLSEIESELEEKSREFDEKKKVIKEIEELRGEKISLFQRQAHLKTVISVAAQQLERIGERIVYLEKDLERHKSNLIKSDILTVVGYWFEEVFITSLRSIEKSVLLSLNQDFNSLFQRWFRDLIEAGELNGYIDEDFTPIVEQGGYELEVESLSGGEKTSVALAYRLALNTVVKQVTDTMKSNLLILDEPTDGFSREQLHKMRDILHDVNCDQIIIVSHEVELENVADHIYQVSKEGNVSTVIAPT